jgi:hypothetical protein
MNVTLALGAAFLAVAAPAAMAQSPSSIDLDTVAANTQVRWKVSEVQNGVEVHAKPVFGATTYGHIAALTIPFTDNNGYWTARVTFTLPAGATNPMLYIATLGVDDRAVVTLNDQPITDSGTYNGGKGYMTYRNDGPNDRRTFSYGSGTQDLTITSGFVPGRNKLKVIVNNTNQGILGVPVPVTAASPSSFGMTGEVTYTPASAP